MDFEITRDMVVVENDDPRVTYSHGWKRVPGEQTLCSGDSYHRACCKGASVRFEFEGSHIWVVGHKSASHGTMKINIDGHPEIATINAWASARELVPYRNLFEHEFAEPGPHWIEVVNDLSGSQITIDSFAYRPMPLGREWVVPLGLKLVTIGDDDPRIEYSGNWTQFSANKNGYHHGGSYHSTTVRGATASVSFESARFWVIGGNNTCCGIYGISVDGGLFETFSANAPSYRGFLIKYERQFAVPGPHRVVMRHEDTTGQVFGFDAIIYEAPP